MPGPAAHTFVVDEVLSAGVLNISVVDRISYYAGQELGGDVAIELEESLRIQDGAGRNFIDAPGGTTSQRPSGRAGRFRWNNSDEVFDIHNGITWQQILDSGAVSYVNLNANGDVGTGAAQVSRGNHTHPLSLVDSGATDIVASDMVLVVDFGTDLIYRYNGSVWDSGLALPAGAGNPAGLAVDGNGDILVVDFGTDLIYRYNGSVWDSGLALPAGAGNPAGLAVAGNGDILVVDTGTDLIYRYNGSVWDSGLALPAGAGNPAGLAVAGNGDILVVDIGTDRIYRYNGTTWDSGMETPSGTNTLGGLAVAGNGDILVVDSTTDRIYRYNGTTWDSGMETPSGTNTPAGLAVELPQQNISLISGTVSGRGVLNLEVATTTRLLQPTVAVSIGGVTQAPDNTIESDNNDVKLTSYRAEVDDGDAYSATITATSDGAAAAIAFLNAGARV